VVTKKKKDTTWTETKQEFGQGGVVIQEQKLKVVINMIMETNGKKDTTWTENKQDFGQHGMLLEIKKKKDIINMEQQLDFGVKCREGQYDYGAWTYWNHDGTLRRFAKSG